MNDSIEIERYVSEIKSFGTRVSRLAEAFRRDIDGQDRIFDFLSPEHWRRAVYGDALIRLRQITENNFITIESISLVATTRYIFELGVWLRLFEKDQRYCLVYYYELLKCNENYWKDTLDQIKREIEFLKTMAEIDGGAQALEGRQTKPLLTSADYGKLVRATMDRVDAVAGRNFSMYADQAKHNGYKYQAYLVAKKALPNAENMLSEVRREQAEFKSRAPKDVQELANKGWLWRKKAEGAGVAHEHDYIYSYASKILHATPASITTDAKNLELSEVRIFLRYIHVKYLEIMDLAYSQPECAIHPVDS